MWFASSASSSGSSGCEFDNEGSMSENQSMKPTRPLCPCGGETRYFGEALMGSLTCVKCGECLEVTGRESLRSLNDRWIRGDRGIVDDEQPV